MKWLENRRMKKGAASLYVVIFTTILFGVIILSFVRIILSETIQSSNDDLSRSAYDSALAGVEDAKIAVNKYYQCLSNSSLSGCNQYSFDNLFGGDCDSFKLKGILYPSSTDSEVKIQESNTSGNNTDQAYTCVIINNVVSDYRSTLTSDTRTRVIPLGIGNQELSKIRRVEFRWYSEINGTTFSNIYPAEDPKSNNLANKSQTSVPPVISLTLLSTKASINLNDYNNAENSDYSTMILHPVNSGGDNSISLSQIENAGDASVDNQQFMIRCEHSEFACTVNLETYRTTARSIDYYTQEYIDLLQAEGNPNASIYQDRLYTNDSEVISKIENLPNVEKGSVSRNNTGTQYYTKADGTSIVASYRFNYAEITSSSFSDGGNAFLIVSLPYGETITDFAVTLYDENDEIINFENVQLSVDSTGRANQLLRRVETRLDPSDSFFPYPDYELTLSGNDDNSFSKNFWITYNCWTEKGACNNNGSL